MRNIFSNTKLNFFALGAVAATAGVKLLKSESFKKGCAKVLYSGMKFKGDILSEVDEIREAAADEYFDYCNELCKECESTLETEEDE